jgi:hypothetical protein
LLAEKTIGPEDLDRLMLTDSVDQIVAELMQCPFKVFEKVPLPKRRWWLGEWGWNAHSKRAQSNERSV